MLNLISLHEKRAKTLKSQDSMETLGYKQYFKLGIHDKCPCHAEEPTVALWRTDILISKGRGKRA